MSRIIKTREVEKHLKDKGSITSWEAIKQYRATRLSAIIFNLRKRYDIDTIMMETDEGIQYGKYVLKGELKDE